MKRTCLGLALIFLASSLPLSAQPDFDDGSPDPRCLTPLWMERQSAPEKMDSKLLRELDDLCGGVGRPVKANNILTASGRFRIHFDLTGSDAVSNVDANHNNIPDYIDSVAYYLDYAWHVEIDDYGFTPPPNDNRGEGPEIDVYICELSAAYYGGAQFETDNVVGLDPTRVSGYLVLDNDYRGYPTSGIPGLMVTTAHELHHLIQFGSYRIALPPYSPVAQYALYEATSTWFEKQVHPSLGDYRQYVDEFLKNPQRYGFSTHNVRDNVTGYAHMLYLEYLATKYGRTIVRDIWNEFMSNETFPAIDRVLARHDFSLARSYCEFANWSYNTGYRARTTNMLPDAATYPALRPASTSSLDANDLSITGELYPLSFGLYRVLVPAGSPTLRDTVDFLVTNARSDIGAGGPSLDLEGFRIDLSRTNVGGYLALTRRQDTLYYQLVSLSGGSHEMFCLDAIDDSVNVTAAVRTSPQPFINRPGEELLFSLGTPQEQIRRVKIWIYTQSGGRVAEIDRSELQSRDNQLGILWNGKDFRGERIPSGVYLYELSINGAEPTLGKLAVIRE